MTLRHLAINQDGWQWIKRQDVTQEMAQQCFSVLPLTLCASVWLQMRMERIRASTCVRRWRRWWSSSRTTTDWERRGALNLKRQQRRTQNMFLSSPAEERSASRTSSCLWRWNLSALRTTVQVGQQENLSACVFNDCCRAVLARLFQTILDWESQRLITQMQQAFILVMHPFRSTEPLLLCSDPLRALQHRRHSPGHSCWRSKWRHHLLPNICDAVSYFYTRFIMSPCLWFVLRVRCMDSMDWLIDWLM